MGFSQHYYIGVDLGATKVLAGLVTPDGVVVARIREVTRTGGVGEWVEQIRQVVRALVVEGSPGQVQGIAVGIPGVVDAATGVVRWVQNLPFIPDLPLAQLLSEAFGSPTVLENDADLAALGEHQFGAGVGTRHMALIAVGTGIGAGLIIDDRPHRGASGVAGAVGWFPCHVSDAAERAFRTLEEVAAGPALAGSVAELIRSGQSSSIVDEIDGGLDKITGDLVVRAAENGDELCLQVVEKAAWHLGVAVANVISMLNPEVVVLGGGVLAGSTWLVDRVRRVALIHAQPVAAKVTRIVATSLGQDAALVGSVPALEGR